MDVCSFCLQPGNVFPTGAPSQFACMKCQPYANSSSDKYNSAMEPQVIVGDTQLSSGNEGSMYCGLCNKTFEKNLQYQNHVRNHRAERKFVCPHCQKAFSQSNNLRAHLRIHTNERPFKCSECGKAFTQVTNLNNHIRLHTGEKPFVCKEPGCDRAFAQVTNLNNHKKSHMRDFRTFKCSYCNKTFAQRNHLTSHVQAEHEAQICNACGEAFPSSSALVIHARECRERAIQVEKRKQENNEQSMKKKMASGGHVKCLFGDCKMYFENMKVLQMHLSAKHGLSINTNKAKPHNSINYSSEVIEIDDDDVPSKSMPSSNKNQQNIRNNGRTHSIKKEETSSSDSESDSSDDEDSDSRECERRKATEQIKMVCSICFLTFDNMKLLERHVKKSH